MLGLVTLADAFETPFSPLSTATGLMVRDLGVLMGGVRFSLELGLSPSDVVVGVRLDDSNSFKRSMNGIEDEKL